MEENLIGHKFGRWLVTGVAETKVTKANRKIRYWHCLCECGTQRAVKEQSLKSGKSKSCGCYHSDIMHVVGVQAKTTHGMSSTRLYRIFRHMHNRCKNTNDIRYKQYGGKGITITDEWNSFEVFKDWALNNGYADDLSIDRIDVNKDYSPDNCRWTDAKTQSNNKSNTKYYTYNGKTHNIGEWSDIMNIPYKTLWKRINAGWDIGKALTT